MSIDPRYIRDISRLTDTADFAGERISKILPVAPNTARSYQKRLAKLGLSWDDVQSMDDKTLLLQLFGKKIRTSQKVMPDCAEIHQRLSRDKHMTLELLHQEYQELHKEKSYGRSQFCAIYRKYLRKIDISLRLHRHPGEAMYVDYAGATIPWIDAENDDKEERACVFVAVLGFSSYTFCCATRSQRIPDFISAHIQAFEYIGGVPESVVPDNLKSAVTTPGIDPVIQRTYQDTANWYRFVILPARVRKPKDKGIAEQAVLLISRWIIAKLRGRKFFSIEEINRAILELLPQVNNKSMRNYEGSRRSRFEESEKGQLKPLPKERFKYAQWVPSQKVANDYHIKVEGHWYSVPFYLVGERVEARFSMEVVEIQHNNKRVATHARKFTTGGHTTDRSHMAPQHLAYTNQSLEEYVRWAGGYGEAAVAVVRAQYAGKRDNSMIANRACAALKSAAKAYEVEDFEAACARAVAIASPTLTSVKSILRTGLYKLEREKLNSQMPLPLHQNVRGANYYSQLGGA